MPELDSDFWLRGLPFILAAVYLAMLVGSILIRSIRGTNNWFVRSQLMVKASLITFLALMATNYLGGPTAHGSVFDAVRVSLGVGSAIGIPFAAQYFLYAWRDEWFYWKWRKTGVPQSPAPIESLQDRDIPPLS